MRPTLGSAARGRAVRENGGVDPEQPDGGPPARGADHFDRWYAAMETADTKDAILARHFALPADLGSAGVLHWDALQEITRHLQVPAGGLLVDLACGRGGYGIEVARRRGASLIGVDFSAVALTRARTIADRWLRPGQAEFRLGALTETGLPTGIADAVMCTDSVQFADPPVAALREIRRMLRPGGRLVLTTWQAVSPGDQRLSPRLRHLDLEHDLQEAGFCDVRVEDKPTWLATERRMWEEAVATPNESGDLALDSLQQEGKRSLATIDTLRRVLATATSPQKSPEAQP